MKYPDIIASIKKGDFAPVYFLYGEEAYFIDQIVRQIEKSALSEEEKSFNQSVIYGKDADINAIIGEAKRYPMMAERVVVLVKEAQHLRKLDELEKYLENPQKSTVLVFAYKYKKLDKRTRIYKLLQKSAVLFESAKLYENKIPGWIEQQLRGRGYQVTPKAVSLLAESLGSDLGRIDSELQKLALVVPHGSTIDDEVVETNVGISKDFNNFELIKAIGDKNFRAAIRIQQYFGANPKDNPLVVTVSLLFGFFSKLMLVHQSKDKSPQALSSLLKVSSYFVDDYRRAAAHYNMKKLAQIIADLRELDTQSKGVGNVSSSDSDLLREFLYKVFYT